MLKISLQLLHLTHRTNFPGYVAIRQLSTRLNLKLNCADNDTYAFLLLQRKLNSNTCLPCVACRGYSKHVTTTTLDKSQSEAAKRKTKGKTAPPESILLISESQNVSVTTLVDAEKLARKKGLVLVQETEQKLHAEKKVYKLETSAQHFGEDWKKKQDDAESHKSSKDKEPTKKKEEKRILLTSKITAHDLEAKVKQMNRLVEKGYPLRVFISGSGDPEVVFKGIEKHLTSCAKIQQKKSSATDIRLQILPQSPPEDRDTQNSNANTQKSKGTANPQQSEKDEAFTES